MLDATTKRRIDTARDILVGKVPDPKSQVEQITIALIYKFMDDIDAGTEEDGGERSFFTGDFAGFGWSKLMDRRLGGHDTLNLYSESITKMSQNPGVPPLFRDIFNNAYLPYRDPETLRSFLRIIDEFSYEDSESLGDAFEYLLSVLDSQGDAGQFRTPRHIIDFIVAVVDPKKNEAVLDPACGTAGFLISSYKHIMAANTGDDDQIRLTPQERGALAENFRGYDISPDMVRLSLVNMYLHGFVAPHIYEYDTLTSEDRWNEYADVILANPPFMSPKGGIRPHNRFSVQAKRSEVLFVDYMAEHLSPTGRAGIIVPEGIIFQSQNAHKQLRKMLVEEYLVAVVSLPAGVFQPYSGVKTSVLILDRALAKRADTIAFFKVENDGFDLGAQRRPIDRNDLPRVQIELAEYLGWLRTDAPLDGWQPTKGIVINRNKVAGDGEYSLAGERHRENISYTTEWPLAAIRDVALEMKSGFACGTSNTESIGVPHIRPMNITERGTLTWDGLKSISEVDFKGRELYNLEPGDVLFNNTNSKELVGKTCFVTQGIPGGFSNHITRIRAMKERCVPQFLALCLHNAWRGGAFLERSNKWIGQAGINLSSLGSFQIPLPPLSVQQEIVAEIEGYQRVIDGARAVVENYRPHIVVDPEWPVVALGDVCTDILSGGTPSTKIEGYWEGDIPWITSADIVNLETAKPRRYITQDAIKASATNLIRSGNVIVVTRVGLGKLFKNGFDVCISQDSQRLILKEGIDANYLVHILKPRVETFQNVSRGSTIQGVTKKQLSEIQVPLPSLEVQEAIATELKTEQAMVEANRQLIERFEQKIQAAVGRVWGNVEGNGAVGKSRTA